MPRADDFTSIVEDGRKITGKGRYIKLSTNILTKYPLQEHIDITNNKESMNLTKKGLLYIYAP